MSRRDLRLGLLPLFSAMTLGASPPGADGPVAYPPSTFSNFVVNDPNADTGTRLTQTDGSAALGAPGTIVVVFTDSGSFAAGSTRFTGYARSTDGGQTFQDLGRFDDNANNDDAGAPTLRRNDLFSRFVASTYPFLTPGVRAFPSVDDGLTWATGNNALSASCVTCASPTIAVDNFAGSGEGSVYLAGRSYSGTEGIHLTHSTDGGNTWGGATLVANIAGGIVENPSLAVGSNHAVYAAWYDASPLGVRVRRSTDFGATFGLEHSAATLLSAGIGGDLGLGAFHTRCHPRFVADPANANRLYLTFADNPAGADRADVYLVNSTDGGSTWSVPLKVDGDAGTNDQFAPSIAITPDGTRLMLGWYDRRDDAGNVLIRYYGRLARLENGVYFFAEEFPISRVPWGPCNGNDPDVTSTYLVNSDGIAADSERFYVPFLDCRAGDPDVRLARIEVDYLFRDGFESSGLLAWSDTVP